MRTMLMSLLGEEYYPGSLVAEDGFTGRIRAINQDRQSHSISRKLMSQYATVTRIIRYREVLKKSNLTAIGLVGICARSSRAIKMVAARQRKESSCPKTVIDRCWDSVVRPANTPKEANKD